MNRLQRKKQDDRDFVLGQVEGMVKALKIVLQQGIHMLAAVHMILLLAKELWCH
jgi:hypothetical protein